MIDLKPYAKTLKYKKAAVFGLGLSGLSAVRALKAADIDVIAWDDRAEQQEKAAALGATIENISESLDSSFDFLVLSPGVPLTHPVPHPVVKKAHAANVEIIGDIELLHRAGHSARHKLTTIGITGTNGKSTTTALMAHVLNQCGMKAIAAGNIGKAVLDLNLAQYDVLVLELSSYQLDLCPTFHPDISILLNITPDHLDRHGTMENYRDVKAKIFEGEGSAIIGIDDVYTKFIANHVEKTRARQICTVSVSGEADISVKEGMLFDGQDKMGSLASFDTLKGAHNHQNCACVYAAAKELDLKAESIFGAMASYPGLPHRQYKVGMIGQVSYINDSKATNAESAAKALSSYDNIFWVVGGRAKEGGLEGLESYAPKIKKAYLIGEAAEDFMAWFNAQNIEAEHAQTLDKAVRNAHDDAQHYGSAASVLLAPACASWDQFQSFEQRGDCFMQEFKKIKEEQE